MGGFNTKIMKMVLQRSRLVAAIIILVSCAITSSLQAQLSTAGKVLNYVKS